MLAATKADFNVLKTLIQFKARIDLRNKDGWTAFHIACRTGNPEIVKYFLQIDGNAWNSKSNIGRTPFHTACKKSQFHYFEMNANSDHLQESHPKVF